MTKEAAPRADEVVDDAVVRNLWLLAAMARLERRIDLLEAHVRILGWERDRWEAKRQQRLRRKE